MRLAVNVFYRCLGNVMQPGAAANIARMAQFMRSVSAWLSTSLESIKLVFYHMAVPWNIKHFVLLL